MECSLTLEDAYRFLRDAAPVLELEGFGIWVPWWWREDRPRLRLRLDIHPLETPAGAEAHSLRLDALVNYDWRTIIK